VTIEEIRSYAKKHGLSENNITSIITELHPNENGELSLQESTQAILFINHIAETTKYIHTVLRATKAIRKRRQKIEAERKYQ
jgi:hypothetical protein